MSGKKLLSSRPHITLDDCIVIQEFLDQGTRLRDLAGQIKKHPSSIVKEIKRSRSRRLPSHFNERAKNDCAHKKTCRKRSVCKPGFQSSWQKGRIEKSHEYIRYVLPKGSSFDGLSQDDVDLLMNHINCTYRDILGESCPFDIACQSMTDVIATLQLYRVPADQIHLKPSLIKQ